MEVAYCLNGKDAVFIAERLTLHPDIKSSNTLIDAEFIHLGGRYKEESRKNQGKEGRPEDTPVTLVVYFPLAGGSHYNISGKICRKHAPYNLEVPTGY